MPSPLILPLGPETKRAERKAPDFQRIENRHDSCPSCGTRVPSSAQGCAVRRVRGSHAIFPSVEGFRFEVGRQKLPVLGQAGLRPSRMAEGVGLADGLLMSVTLGRADRQPPQHLTPAIAESDER
jgi:hypothetical protein